MRSLKPLHIVVAGGLGSGFSPIAPGTCGSLAFAALWIICGTYWINFGVESQAAIALFVTVLGLWAVSKTLRSIEAPQAGEKVDPQFVVIDEWAGMAVSLLGSDYKNTFEIICAFALFRFFDIIKPWPIRHLERLRAEWGVMLDDLAAGIYALIVLCTVRAFYY